MKHEHRALLAQAVRVYCGDLVEFWSDMLENGTLPEELADAHPQEAAEVLGRWMTPLPGDKWDVRLPQPE